MSRKAVYPGTFDPVTNGHIDIIDRASKQFDEVIIGVLRNSSKNPLFSEEERVKLLADAVAAYPNVTVKSFDGLSVNFVKECGAGAIIRGLRATTDFEYELQMAQMNRVLDSGIDTMFFITNLRYAYLSSSIVKEVAMHGGDISKLVMPHVEEALRRKFADR